MNAPPGSQHRLQCGSPIRPIARANSLQLCGQFTRHWGAAADISGLHIGVLPNVGAGLDLVTAVFGPRLTMAPPNRRYRVYGQALGGVTNGLNSLFPGSSGAATTATGPALLLGGGTDLELNRRLSYCLLDAAWLRTQLSSGTTTVQNDLRLGTGLVLRF